MRAQSFIVMLLVAVIAVASTGGLTTHASSGGSVAGQIGNADLTLEHTTVPTSPEPFTYRLALPNDPPVGTQLRDGESATFSVEPGFEYNVLVQPSTDTTYSFSASCTDDVDDSPFPSTFLGNVLFVDLGPNDLVTCRFVATAQIPPTSTTSTTSTTTTTTTTTTSTTVADTTTTTEPEAATTTAVTTTVAETPTTTAPATSVATTTTVAGTLPETGSAGTTLTALLALVAVATGSALLLVRRRAT